MVDLAGILGLHSMLNQDQYHASIMNKGQIPLTDKFESVVKSTMPKKLPPMEPDNVTDPEKTAKQVMENDPSLTELNWNNIKYIPRETFKKLFNGLKTNTNLTELHLSNTGLTDGPAEVSAFFHLPRAPQATLCWPVCWLRIDSCSRISTKIGPNLSEIALST